jgi:hypothetical protein
MKIMTTSYKRVSVEHILVTIGDVSYHTSPEQTAIMDLYYACNINAGNGIVVPVIDALNMIPKTSSICLACYSIRTLEGMMVAFLAGSLMGAGEVCGVKLGTYALDKNSEISK